MVTISEEVQKAKDAANEVVDVRDSYLEWVKKNPKTVALVLVAVVAVAFAVVVLA